MLYLTPEPKCYYLSLGFRSNRVWEPWADKEVYRRFLPGRKQQGTKGE